MRARKKPVEVEVIEFNGWNWRECLEFSGANYILFMDVISYRKELQIETLEGTMTASVGDYIIKGIQGEVYPCKPDIFKETYDILN